eukprot:3615956-Ditylum_brightwellii.AAC.1
MAVANFSSDIARPILPIHYDSNLPHFDLLVGTDNMDIRLSLAYDRCAVFCVSWAGYHLAIAKEFPHIVKSLIWAKDDYTPITLSRIVSPEDTESTRAVLKTTLPAVI